jgi:DNA polymerase-3 subunit epsilon
VERSLLGEAFPLHGFGPWIDTLELVRIAYPRCASHRLEVLVEDIGVGDRVRSLCPGLAPHDAAYDAAACAAVLEHLLDLPHWEGVSVEDLAAARSGWLRGRRKRATG